MHPSERMHSLKNLNENVFLTFHKHTTITNKKTILGHELVQKMIDL